MLALALDKAVAETVAGDSRTPMRDEVEACAAAEEKVNAFFRSHLGD